MSEDCLKLTIYFGERDRLDGKLVCDRLLDLFGRERVSASIMLRGIEGFGAKHQLRSQRLLTLSEDLPLVVVAVDTPGRIETVAAHARAIVGAGLLTLERANLSNGSIDPAMFDQQGGETVKATFYLGRRESADGQFAYRTATRILREHGMDAATTFLGLDGTIDGERRRARFFSRNARVPTTVVSVGTVRSFARALGPLHTLLERPVLTLENVRVLKHDGVAVAPLPVLPETDEEGLSRWQKLTVFCSERDRHDGRPLYLELIHRLRTAGASGATALRGIWTYSGDQPPHGDRLLSLTRQVPVAVIVIDSPANIRRWWRLVDGVTDTAGLAICETLPALEAHSLGEHRGGLRPARPLPG